MAVCQSYPGRAVGGIPETPWWWVVVLPLLDFQRRQCLGPDFFCADGTEVFFLAPSLPQRPWAGPTNIWSLPPPPGGWATTGGGTQIQSQRKKHNPPNTNFAIEKNTKNTASFFLVIAGNFRKFHTLAPLFPETNFLSNFCHFWIFF